MSNGAPILEYAGPRDEVPLNPRIQCFPVEGGGVRFVDPPLGWRAMAGNVLLCSGGLVFCLYWVITTLAEPDGMGWGRMAYRGVVLVAVGVMMALLSMDAKMQAEGEVVIEVTGGEIRVDRPQLLRRSFRWRAEELWDVRASIAMPTIGPLRGARMVAALMIVPRWRVSLRLLEKRDAAEVRWVVRELRRALGLPARSN